LSRWDSFGTSFEIDQASVEFIKEVVPVRIRFHFFCAQCAESRSAV
jgi:hypothetical protein